MAHQPQDPSRLRGKHNGPPVQYHTQLDPASLNANSFLLQSLDSPDASPSAFTSTLTTSDPLNPPSTSPSQQPTLTASIPNPEQLLNRPSRSPSSRSQLSIPSNQPLPPLPSSGSFQYLASPPGLKDPASTPSTSPLNAPPKQSNLGRELQEIQALPPPGMGGNKHIYDPFLTKKTDALLQDPIIIPGVGIVDFSSLDTSTPQDLLYCTVYFPDLPRMADQDVFFTQIKIPTDQTMKQLVCAAKRQFHEDLLRLRTRKPGHVDKRLARYVQNNVLERAKKCRLTEFNNQQTLAHTTPQERSYQPTLDASALVELQRNQNLGLNSTLLNLSQPQQQPLRLTTQQSSNINNYQPPQRIYDAQLGVSYSKPTSYYHMTPDDHNFHSIPTESPCFDAQQRPQNIGASALPIMSLNAQNAPGSAQNGPSQADSGQLWVVMRNNGQNVTNHGSSPSPITTTPPGSAAPLHIPTEASRGDSASTMQTSLHSNHALSSRPPITSTQPSSSPTNQNVQHQQRVFTKQQPLPSNAVSPALSASLSHSLSSLSSNSNGSGSSNGTPRHHHDLTNYNSTNTNRTPRGSHTTLNANNMQNSQCLHSQNDPQFGPLNNSHDMQLMRRNTVDTNNNNNNNNNHGQVAPFHRQPVHQHPRSPIPSNSLNNRPDSLVPSSYYPQQHQSSLLQSPTLQPTLSQTGSFGSNGDNNTGSPTPPGHHSRASSGQAYGIPIPSQHSAFTSTVPKRPTPSYSGTFLPNPPQPTSQQPVDQSSQLSSQPLQQHHSQGSPLPNPSHPPRTDAFANFNHAPGPLSQILEGTSQQNSNASTPLSNLTINNPNDSISHPNPSPHNSQQQSLHRSLSLQSNSPPSLLQSLSVSSTSSHRVGRFTVTEISSQTNNQSDINNPQQFSQPSQTASQPIPFHTSPPTTPLPNLPLPQSHLHPSLSSNSTLTFEYPPTNSNSSPAPHPSLHSLHNPPNTNSSTTFHQNQQQLKHFPYDASDCFLDFGFIVEDIFGDESDVQNCPQYELVVWDEANNCVDTNYPPFLDITKLTHVSHEAFALQIVKKQDFAVMGEMMRGGRRQRINPGEQDDLLSLFQLNAGSSALSISGSGDKDPNTTKKSGENGNSNDPFASLDDNDMAAFGALVNLERKDRYGNNTRYQSKEPGLEALGRNHIKQGMTVADLSSSSSFSQSDARDNAKTQPNGDLAMTSGLDTSKLPQRTPGRSRYGNQSLEAQNNVNDSSDSDFGLYNPNKDPNTGETMKKYTMENAGDSDSDDDNLFTPKVDKRSKSVHNSSSQKQIELSTSFNTETVPGKNRHNRHEFVPPPPPGDGSGKKSGADSKSKGNDKKSKKTSSGPKRSLFHRLFSCFSSDDRSIDDDFGYGKNKHNNIDFSNMEEEDGHHTYPARFHDDQSADFNARGRLDEGDEGDIDISSNVRNDTFHNTTTLRRTQTVNQTSRASHHDLPPTSIRMAQLEQSNSLSSLHSGANIQTMHRHQQSQSNLHNQPNSQLGSVSKHNSQSLSKSSTQVDNDFDDSTSNSDLSLHDLDD